MVHFTDYTQAADAGSIGDTTLVPFRGDEVWTIVAYQSERLMGERKVIARSPSGRRRMELNSTGGYGDGYVGARMTAREILGSDAERRAGKLPAWVVATDEES